uniref:Uncharacterized protein n=1 Tax=viral metagenome TaxID=1070528 RepID=A0A6H1ZUP7_9ZZZZ
MLVKLWENSYCEKVQCEKRDNCLIGPVTKHCPPNVKDGEPINMHCKECEWDFLIFANEIDNPSKTLYRVASSPEYCTTDGTCNQCREILADPNLRYKWEVILQCPRCGKLYGSQKAITNKYSLPRRHVLCGPCDFGL